MPSQALDTTLRELAKGHVRPVYYLVGTEDLLKDELTRMIIEAVLDPNLRDFNFDQRSAASLDPEQLFTLLNTLPMMADRRVVILRDIESWQKRSRGRAELLRYLQKPAAETVLLLVQGGSDPEADSDLASNATTVECAPLTADRAKKWLLRQAKQAGLEVPDDAASHLVEVTYGDLGAIKGELEKLAALPEGTEITRELVGELVGIRHGQTAYDWRDAVFAGDTARALALLAPVLNQTGMSGVRLVNLVGTTLAGLSLARAHYDKGTRGGSLERSIFNSLRTARPYGLPSWNTESQKWGRWAESWPQARINQGFRDALAADMALKDTGLRDEHAILSDLVLLLQGIGAARAA